MVKRKEKEVCGADSAVGPPFTRDLGWKVEAGGRGDEKKLAVSTSYYKLLTSDAYRTSAGALFKIRESTEMMSGTFEEKV